MMSEENVKEWVTYIINGVIFSLIIIILLGVVVTSISIFKLQENKIIEIKVKDVIKTENAYIIFDTDNSMYAYSKLIPEISAGKNYTVKYDYAISTFYKFYKVDGIAEV